ncbi:hypothetical protein GCK72_005984 [Caenorhabditis remanei]|uniref:Uncharacterized protein n=1 Tax=Caenorhabditis remanei TaxID=31234 RepID=A0A6A5HFN1_CAERE|nr:hypothetical protein GCK72_005984 [Caenorhabditis remanei]KAF1766029.1 hypothetical protein GCK72_005984 [Caenorhabditis remanei]
MLIVALILAITSSLLTIDYILGTITSEMFKQLIGYLPTSSKSFIVTPEARITFDRLVDGRKTKEKPRQRHRKWNNNKKASQRMYQQKRTTSLNTSS